MNKKLNHTHFDVIVIIVMETRDYIPKLIHADMYLHSVLGKTCIVYLFIIIISLVM